MKDCRFHGCLSASEHRLLSLDEGALEKKVTETEQEKPEEREQGKEKTEKQSLFEDILGRRKERIGKADPALAFQRNRLGFDRKGTERARAHNEQADAAANTVAKLFTLGAAPEAHTETADRFKKVEAPAGNTAAGDQTEVASKEERREETVIKSESKEEGRTASA